MWAFFIVRVRAFLGFSIGAGCSRSIRRESERGGEKGLFVPFLGGIAVLSKGRVESFAV